MHHAEIARVFQADGPFTSLYMDTEGDVEQAADRVAVRWRNLRGSMLAAGVPEGTVAALDPLVEGSHMAGATLAVIAAVDRPLYSANLPDPPPRDTLLRHGALPDVVPLLAVAQAAGKRARARRTAARSRSTRRPAVTATHGGRPSTISSACRSSSSSSWTWWPGSRWPSC